MNLRIAIISILCVLTASLSAQERNDSIADLCQDARPCEQRGACKRLNRESSTMLLVGSREQWDTYLSNERYKGTSVGLLSEKSRPTHWFGRRLYVQHLTQGDLALCKTRADKHNTISGLFHWQVAWQYHFLPAESPWEVNAGPGLQTNLGFVYNTLGGNNPASAKASLHVIASAQARRHFNIGRHRFTGALQADVPLSGVLFSPDYGQSYYEIFSLGKYSHNICYAFPLKAFQANTMLTLDWHLKPTTSLRVGYQGVFMQSDANNLKTQDFSHHFIIGYVRNF